VADDEIVRHIRESSDPAFTTKEIAQEFGMSVPGIRNRLEDLAERGRIERKKPAKRTIVWWHESDEGQPLCSK